MKKPPMTTQELIKASRITPVEYELKQLGSRVTMDVALALEAHSKRTRIPQAVLVQQALETMLRGHGYDV